MFKRFWLIVAAFSIVACGLNTDATGLFARQFNGDAGQSTGGTNIGGFPSSGGVAGQSTGGTGDKGGTGGTMNNGGTAGIDAGGTTGSGGIVNDGGPDGQAGNAGSGGTGGQGGNAGFGGTGGGQAGSDGGSHLLFCNSTANPSTPYKVVITSTGAAIGKMGASFMPYNIYSQTSPSPITIAGYQYPAEIVQIAANDVNLTFYFSKTDAGAPVYPKFYYFQPTALPYGECAGNKVFDYLCLKKVSKDFRCQFLKETGNCPLNKATFTPQGVSKTYSRSGSGIHGVLALIRCP